MFDVEFCCWEVACLGWDDVPFTWISRPPENFSGTCSAGDTMASVSSAQFIPEGPVGIVAGTGAESLDGVIVPDAALLEAPVEAPEDIPLAACAYENGTAAAATSLPDRRGVVAMILLYGNCLPNHTIRSRNRSRDD